MSNNRIGIEVQVEFPTVKELQSQLQTKWAKVKNSFEGKINIGIDGNSLRSAKTKIRTALKEDTFEIKLDANTTQAEKKINNIIKRVEELDKKLSKSRELKIDFKSMDFNKSFRDVLKDIKDTDDAVAKQTRNIRLQTQELEKQGAHYDKIKQVQKQLADGSVKNTTQMTYNESGGRTNVITQTADGSQHAYTEDRVKALKEIESVMKSVNDLEKKREDAIGKQSELIDKELRIEREQLDILKAQYQERHKTDAMKDPAIEKLVREKEILKIAKEQSFYEKLENEEKAQTKSELTTLVKLENLKETAIRNAVKAQGEERKTLAEKATLYQKNIDKLIKTSGIMDKLSDAQKEELEQVRKVNRLELQRTKEAERQKQLTKQQTAEENAKASAIKSANSDMMSQLKKILSIEEKIAQLRNQEKNDVLSGKEEAKLATLRSQLQEHREILKTTEDEYNRQGLITKELQDQMAETRQLSQHEKKRIADSEKIKMSHKEVGEELSRHKSLTSEISKLQRDLVFAGLREENIIEDRIEHLRKERSEIEKKLAEANKMPATLQKEIAQMEKLQAEQMELNRLRQNARDKDRTFNDAGGIIDPWQAWSTAQQGAMAILEPVKRLDEAMTGITKVAEATDAQFKEFAQTSYDVGSSLGVTADQYMLAVEKWVTAGKTFKESQELGQISLTGAFVGNIEPDDMVKYMSVPLNSYAEAGLEANDIINVMNETANNHAIEMEELGKAYVRSANTAKDAGVTYTELTGMITGAQEATRKGGERIGTGIKSIAMNIGAISSQLTGQNERKYDWLAGIGVEVNDANGEMKSMTEVLGELSGVWDGLSDNEKSTAKFYLAGKEHAETIGAIIDQWEKSVKSTVDMSNQELGQGNMGSAYLEHAKQSDSLRFKLAELQNSWEELMYTLSGDGGTAVSVIDAIIQVLDTANELAKNDKLMEILKLLIVSLGMKAGWNLMGRVFDGMNAGAGSLLRNLRNISAELGSIKKKSKGGVGSSDSSGGGTSVYATSGVAGKKGYKNDESPNSKKAKETTSGGSSIYATSGLGKGKSSNKELRNDMKETAKTAQNVTKETEKVSSNAVKSLARAGKSALSLIPLLGDGLLIMELMGVPVFDKIGEGFNSITSSAKEANAEIIETRKQFIATNKVLNGEVTSNDKKFKGIEQTYAEDRQSGGYMDSQEFVAFQDQFNGFADELGIDIEVTMNDTKHIEEKLQELKKYLHEVKSEEVIKLETEIADTQGNMKEIEKQYADRLYILDEQKKSLEELKERKIEFEQLYERTGSETYLNEIRRLEDKEKRTGDYIDYLNSAIEDNKQAWNAGADSVTAFAKEIESYVKSGGEFADLQKSSVVAYLNEAVPAYNELQDGVNKLTSAEKKLKDGKELTYEEYRKLQALYPELSVLNKNEVGEIQKIVSEKKAQGEESLISAGKNIEAAAQAVGAEAQIRNANGKTKVSFKDTGEVIDGVRHSIEKVPKSKSTEVSVWVKMKEQVKGLWNKIFGGSSKNTSSTHTINVQAKDKNISLGNSSSSVSSSSSSISTGGEAIQGIANENSGKSNATSSKSKATSSTSNANARVNEDVWRYWSHEMFNIARLEQSMSSLERAIVVAGDNQTKLISLYKQQYSVLKQQYNSQKYLQSQKDKEMNSILGQLKKYGFKVDTKSNKISNLNYSKYLKGDKAEKADGLLSQYRSLYDEMNGINNTLRSIGNEMTGLTETIKQAEITREMESFEKTLKKVSAVMKAIDNMNSLYSSRLSLVGGQDKELALGMNRNAMVQSQKNLSNLKAQYDALAVKRVNNKENAEQFHAQLESIATSMLTEADSIIAYQDAVNQLEFERVTADLDKFSGAVERNLGRLENTRENLKEGILSGSDVSDLASGAKDLDLSRNNVYERQANARLKLEYDLNQALDKYAQMNVDRTKKVVNTQLRMTSDGYSQLLRMYDTYQNGQKTSYKQVESNFKGGLESVGKNDPSYTLVTKFDKAFETIRQKQLKLDAELEKSMSSASTFEERERLTNEYVSNNLKIQEEYFKAMIKANKDSISELNAQLKDATLTDDARQSILEQVSALEDEIMDTQNQIKDTIAERIEFENSLLQESIEQYDEYISKIESALSVIDAVGGNSESKGVLLEALLGSESERKEALKSTINTLEKQLSLYEKGSFEWKLINEQMKEFNDQLLDSNNNIIGINQNILENSFGEIVKQIEKGMFDGNTLKQFQEAQELWLSTLEREMALEDMYQRIADLGADGHKLKLEELEKREKISRFEMDYMDKQMTLLELQQKMANLSQERNVQTLRQNEDGTWNWSYEADASELETVEDEIQNLQKEMLDMENQARESYLSKLESILSEAQSGEFETINEFKDAINELGKAYESIINGAPEISNDYLNKIIEAYQRYMDGTGGIVGDIISGASKSSSSFKETKLGTVASSLAESILSNGFTVNPQSPVANLVSSKDTSQVFHIDKIEFPNAESENDIRNALLSLPSVAEQHKFKKN